MLERDVSPEEYATWLNPCVLLMAADNQLIIGTPNVFVRDQVQKKYKPYFEVALSQSCGRLVTVQVEIGLS